jgi:hypothetical protein
MVTLARLNFDDTQELHRRLGRKWRNAATLDLAKRQYRLMCRVFTHADGLMRSRVLH